MKLLPSRTVPNAPIRHTARRTTSSAAKCVSHLCQKINRRPRYVRPTSLGVLNPFLIGRMFVRGPSWEYSASLVGALLGDCLFANLVGALLGDSLFANLVGALLGDSLFANLVGALLGECLFANLVGSIRRT